MPTTRTPSLRCRRREAGFSIIELMIASGALLLGALSLASAFTSSTICTHASARAGIIHESMAQALTSLEDTPFDQLLAMNSTTVHYRGDSSAPANESECDHEATINANLAQVGLILIEVIVTDDRTGIVLARRASYRAEGT